MDLTVFYGGTFDPVHNGHLAVARSARDVLGVTIHLMPAADPPHRAAPGASALQRARMLDLAVAGEPGMVVDRREVSRGARSYSVDTLREVREQLGAQAPVALLLGADSLLGLASWKEWQTLFTLAHFVVAERIGNNIEARLPPELQAFTKGRWVATAGEPDIVVDRRELRRDGPSYTIDTLHGLRAELGDQLPIAWLIGSDSLAALDSWHRWRELFGVAHILAVERAGSQVDAASLGRHAPAVQAEIAPRWRPAEQLQASPSGGFAVLPLPRQRAESSTEIRRRILAGEPWQDWVPPPVATYIDRHRLYAARPRPPAPL